MRILFENLPQDVDVPWDLHEKDGDATALDLCATNHDVCKDVTSKCPLQKLAALRQFGMWDAETYMERRASIENLLAPPFSICSKKDAIGLSILDLGRKAIGDAGLSVLANALSSGALLALEELFLNSNQIGDAGMSAFASACASGALEQLQVCWRPSAL